MECKRVEEVGRWLTWRENDRSTALADLKAGIEAKRAGLLLLLKKYSRWWNTGARKREREWTRSERWFYDYKKRTYEALSVNVSSLRSLIRGKKVQQRVERERDLNYGNIVSLSVLRDVMDKYKYSGECEENLYDRA